MEHAWSRKLQHDPKCYVSAGSAVDVSVLAATAATLSSVTTVPAISYSRYKTHVHKP